MVTKNVDVAGVSYKNVRQHDITTNYKVTIAMHCNLRLSDVALVVLAIVHQLTKFQHNRAMND